MARNIDLARPIATEILDLEKPGFCFFAQMAVKTTSVHIRLLHPRLSRKRQ